MVASRPGGFPPGHVPMGTELLTEVQYLKGVGPARAASLARLGIRTVEDLLHHYPRRLEDRSQLQPIGTVVEGEVVTVGGTVGDVSFRRMRGRLSLTSVLIYDDSGSLELAFWNQPFRRRQFDEGQEVIVTGKVTFKRGFVMTSPEVEIVSGEEDDEVVHTGRVVPVYPLTKGVRAGEMRRIVWNAIAAVLDQVEEHLPDDLLESRGLVTLPEALRSIHFPDDPDAAEDAARRLKYDELFLLECALALRRQRIKQSERGMVFKVSAEMDERIRARFPWTLTGAQDKAIREITEDLRSPHPMARLLQGDVGSGKTAVALYAILVAVANGRQAAVMAPTEILAEQHFQTFTSYLADSRVTIELLLGRLPAKRRRAILAGLADGTIDVAVGTQALIQEDVDFQKLGLVVVDEQHRFGVMQRAFLKWKGELPDTLFMTATPIPRTLSLTLFGDLDFSEIREMPPGRLPPRTHWFPEEKLPGAYEFIRQEIAKGRQAFFVFPLVEESEELPLPAVTEEIDHLREVIFPETQVGIIHGRMKREEKEEAMRRFRAGEDRILAATTVVEVGIDVPNATVMVVINAERYGLSQLHQLRGRIGRGGGESTMLLLGDAKTPEGRRRLQVMCETTDGFRIADEDLALRGPGEVLGTRQHGLPDLRIADLAQDFDLLRDARADAFALVGRDPELKSPVGARVRVQIARRLGSRISLASV